MMLRHSFDLEEHAKRIENAVPKVLAEGYRTADIMQEGGRKVGTDAMGEAVVAAVRATG
jgi:3-isopropylmalate dehydrogenase